MDEKQKNIDGPLRPLFFLNNMLRVILLPSVWQTAGVASNCCCIMEAYYTVTNELYTSVWLCVYILGSIFTSR